jgi:hypothetical protein
VPAGDVDFVDDEAQQGLFLGEVEGVDQVQDPGGEVADAVTQLVVASQLVALCDQGVAAFGEVAAAVLDVGGAALQLGQLDEAGLVEVDEAAAFAVGGVELAVQSGQLGGEQVVVGGRGAHGEGLFAGGEHVGAQQRGADLVEDERVEGVGADVAFGAAPVRAAGFDRVVVAAVVVAVPGAVAAAHLVTVGADAAGPAFDQAAQQPLAGFGAPWAPLAVVAAGAMGGGEGGLVDDRGHRDGDPVLAGAGDLLAALAGARVGNGFGAVEVDPPDVGLVAQQLAQRGGAPQPVTAAGRGRHVVGGQPADDLAQRVPADRGVEDPADHRGLGFEHLQPGRAVDVAGLAAVAVGGAPGQHLSGARAEQLPAPVPFGDLCSLVLGDHALDLGEQLRLRIVRRS